MDFNVLKRKIQVSNKTGFNTASRLAIIYSVLFILSIFIFASGFYGWTAITDITAAQKSIYDKLDSLTIVFKSMDENFKNFSSRYNNYEQELAGSKNIINDLEKKIGMINNNFARSKNALEARDNKDKSIDLPIPQNVWIEYAEKNLVINWDPVDRAIGYNVYRSAEKQTQKKMMEKLNQRLITSNTRFVFIWRFDQGERERTVKGYQHYISVTAVFNDQRNMVESALSPAVSNQYFDGFANMTSENRIKKILRDEQKSAFLPLIYGSNDQYNFIKFMTGPGRFLIKVLRDSLDFQEVGACDPVSTIALKLLSDWGLYALRAEGYFIEEFHTFIVIKVDKVEYILDFTADQFIPDIAPVMVPRDLCYLSKQGKLDNAGQPIYLIDKVYPAESFELNSTKKSRVYHNVYLKVYNEYIELKPIKNEENIEIIE
jgi:hypothetical protein